MSWSVRTREPGRRRRRPILRVLALTAALAAGLVVASAAQSGVRAYAPPKSVCVGTVFKVGVRYRPGGSAIRSFRIEVVDPRGTRLLSLKGRAAKKWRYWSVKPGRSGVHVVRYRLGKGKKTYNTEAIDCQTAPPAPTAPPTAPPTSPPASPPAPPTPTGTVSIQDNDAGAAMFAIAGAKPGRTDDSCTVVTYTGTLPASVRLYGSTGGTGLDAYLDLTVTRGSLPAGSFDSCDGFTPDAADYGAGAGVIYRGTLAAYPDEFSTGIRDAPGAHEVWTQGESHAYRFQIAVQDSNEAQGKAATQTFVWEARDE